MNHTPESSTPTKILGPLKNKKWEAFAIGIVKGLTPTQAYLNAGYSSDPGKAASSRLNNIQEVANRINHLRAKLGEGLMAPVSAMLAEDIRERIGRVAALAERRDALKIVIQERAVYPEHQDVPGGKTGYVVTSWKALTKDRTIKTHRVDVELLKELRAIEQQIAMELGQWDSGPMKPVEGRVDVAYSWLPEEQSEQQPALPTAVMEAEKTVQ